MSTIITSTTEGTTSVTINDEATGGEIYMDANGVLDYSFVPNPADVIHTLSQYHNQPIPIGDFTVDPSGDPLSELTRRVDYSLGVDYSSGGDYSSINGYRYDPNPSREAHIEGKDLEIEALTKKVEELEKQLKKLKQEEKTSYEKALKENQHDNAIDDLEI